MGERIVFSTNNAGTNGYAHEVGPLSHTIHKNISKQIIDLNVRAKTIKHLEDSTRLSLNDPELGNGFLNMTPTEQAI